ncbi:hypothetical protein BC830DRAFT_1087535 [Chytriomyces sp. MP71]|nr:hypothetical protein BC830DRAFT_1087535 [Chytriomyces sp. MP71]
MLADNKSDCSCSIDVGDNSKDDAHSSELSATNGSATPAPAVNDGPCLASQRHPGIPWDEHTPCPQCVLRGYGSVCAHSRVVAEPLDWAECQPPSNPEVHQFVQPPPPSAHIRTHLQMASVTSQPILYPTTASSLLSSRPLSEGSDAFAKSRKNRPTPCNACRSLRKRCDLLKPRCTRCKIRGTECSYRGLSIAERSVGAIRRLDGRSKSQPAEVQVHSSTSLDSAIEAPCSYCRADRKHCDLGCPSCSRCLEKGLSCKYSLIRSVSETSVLSLEGLPFSFPDSQSPGNFNPLPSTLNRILDAMDLTYLESSCHDPDTPVSFDDWKLVYNFVHNSGVGIRSSFSFLNPTALLSNFFNEPRVLRLVLCSVAAFLQKPPVISTVSFSFYFQARESLSQTDAPSFKALQSCYLLALLTHLKGHPSATLILYQKCAAMLECLQLAGNCPPPPQLPLEDNQAEWLSLCWSLSSSLQIVSVCSNRAISPTFANNFQILQPTLYQIGNSLQMSPVAYIRILMDIVSDIVEAVKFAPTQVADLFQTPRFFSLKMRLSSFYHSLDSAIQIKVYSSNLKNILAGPETSCKTLLNIFLNAAYCQLQRPQLYLSAHRAPTSFVTPHDCRTVQVAFTSSLTHAQQIGRITGVLLHHLPDFRETPSVYYYAIFPLFEAAIVMWFVSCKTLPSWWEVHRFALLHRHKEKQKHYMHHSTSESDDTATDVEFYDDESPTASPSLKQTLIQNVKDILAVLKIFNQMIPTSEQHPTSTTSSFDASLHPDSWQRPSVLLEPLIVCAQAMINEMECQGVLERRAIEDVSFSSTNTVRKVVYLELDTDDKYLGTRRTPWAFLGLLGAEINGKCNEVFRWGREEGEERWRLFWDSSTIL